MNASAVLKMGKVIVRCTRIESRRISMLLPSRVVQCTPSGRRSFCTEVPVEDQIAAILNREFEPTAIDVKDVSGGCGAMFNISVESIKFKGVSLLNQHKMVTKALAAEIKNMHGVNIKTSVPK